MFGMLIELSGFPANPASAVEKNDRRPAITRFPSLRLGDVQ
jgi:hypothetical protein